MGGCGLRDVTALFRDSLELLYVSSHVSKQRGDVYNVGLPCLVLNRLNPSTRPLVLSKCTWDRMGKPKKRSKCGSKSLKWKARFYSNGSGVMYASC